MTDVAPNTPAPLPRRAPRRRDGSRAREDEVKSSPHDELVTLGEAERSTGLPSTYDYSHPGGPCDIVMKGGITSGVVYPYAVCEIARHYRLKNIGGTSAGAIAATAAAAAEYGRQAPGGGFKLLAEQPRWLGEGTRLLDLFQPQQGTKRTYRVFLAALEGKTVPGRSLMTVGAIITTYWWAAFLGGALGITTGYALATSNSLRWPVLGLVSVALLTLIGAVVGATTALIVGFTRNVPSNRFGLCTGFGDGVRRGTPPLTEWLADLIDKLAGLSASEGPLTFGQLIRGRDGTGTSSSRAINLQMITTNLSQGTPHRLPFESGTWFFDPVEFAEYFPPRIVTHLIEKSREELAAIVARDSASRSEERRLLHRLVGNRMLPLPAPENLPVVVATRFSLSFPVLLSAIPLYVVDYTIKENAVADGRWRRWLQQHREEWTDLLHSDHVIGRSPPKRASL